MALEANNMGVYSDYPETEDESNLHMDEPDPSTVTDQYFGKASSGRPFYKKTWFWLVSAGVILVIGVVGTIVGLARSGSNGGNSVGTELPRPDLPTSVVNANRNELGQILLTMYNERGMDWEPVGELDTFQGQALTFVAGSSSYSQLSRSQNIEKYALVVFYLSTFRQPHLLLAVAQEWTSNRNWLSKESVCVWEGIVCNNEDSVQEILLPNHQLSGTLPAELSLLLNLETIDLTTNYIYMEAEHHFLWTIMPDLVELTMDDNYFVSENGLPAQFIGLKSIEKISLSYNLLQGRFDGELFNSLQNLQHLEIESNYIEGPLPPELLSLSTLVYLYVRRNSLEIDLDELFSPGNLPSIFALWLDSNIIGGTIPSSIGLYTDIASLSITDAELSGPLPSELGNLVNMRRCWLYDNQLTGDIPSTLSSWTDLQVFEIYGNNLVGEMPQPICSAIAASNYEFRTLSADCTEVSCNNCCTECM
jgi:hypothetical protein